MCFDAVMFITDILSVYILVLKETLCHLSVFFVVNKNVKKLNPTVLFVDPLQELSQHHGFS